MSKIVAGFMTLLLSSTPAAAPGEEPTAPPRSPGTGSPSPPADERTWRVGEQCGRNAIYMLLKLHGTRPTYSDIEARVPVQQGGSKITDMRDCARAYGLGCKIVRATPEALSRCRLPVIAHGEELGTDSGHYVVVLKVSKDSILLIDGTTASVAEMPPTEFDKMWTGYLLAIEEKSWSKAAAPVALAAGVGTLLLTALVRRRRVAPAAGSV